MWCAAYYTDTEKDLCSKVVVQSSDFHLDIVNQALYKEEYVHKRKLDEALSTYNKQNFKL